MKPVERLRVEEEEIDEREKEREVERGKERE